MNITKEAFQRTNEAYNRYYDKFQSCKQAWKKGLIFGSLIGVGLAALISGFQFDETFFCMLIFTVISGIMIMAAIFGLRYTEDFGLSCITRGIVAVGNAGCEFFAGTYVLAWVAYLLIGLSVTGWLFGVILFSFLFPLETLYYWIRYRLDMTSIRSGIYNGRIAVE